MITSHHSMFRRRSAVPVIEAGRAGGSSWLGVAACLVLCLTLGACVAGSAESHHSAASGAIGQALLGFWHGLIAPMTLLVEIVNHLAPHLLPWKTRLFEPDGTGVLYDIGFYLGLAGSPVIVARRFSR